MSTKTGRKRKECAEKVEKENIERDREREKMLNEMKWGRRDADNDCSCWWMTNHIIIGKPFESENMRTFTLYQEIFWRKQTIVFSFLKCARPEPHAATAKRWRIKNWRTNSQCQLNGMAHTSYLICYIQIQRSTIHLYVHWKVVMRTYET